MMIKIVFPQGDELKTGQGTKFFNADGVEVEDVSRCVITIAPDEVLQAELRIAVGQVKDVCAHPLLDLETVKAAAERHGFVLIEQVVADKVQTLLDLVGSFNAPPAPEPPMDAVARHNARKLS